MIIVLKKKAYLNKATLIIQHKIMKIIIINYMLQKIQAIKLEQILPCLII
jgi:hypothetical protein